MARLGITYEEVAQAAESILSEGRNPTMESVRAMLGGTGSFTTINKHLHSWRAERLLAAAKVPLKPVMSTDEVGQAVHQVWEQLNAQAQQKIEKVQQESDEKITGLSEEIAALHQEKALLVTATDQANIKVNHLEAELMLIKKELVEERQHRGRAQERAQNKEDAFIQLQAETTLRVAELQKAYAEALHQLNQQFEAIHNQHKSDADHWKTLTENQRRDFMVKLDELKTAKEKVEKAQLKAEIELNQQLSRNKEHEEQLRGYRFDLKTAEQQMHETALQLMSCKTEMAIKDQMIEACQQKFERAKEEIGGLKATFKNKK